MESCPFCLFDPSRKWIENECAIAIPDAFPVADGHMLVIPRKHVASIYELKADEQSAAWARRSDQPAYSPVFPPRTGESPRSDPAQQRPPQDQKQKLSYERPSVAHPADQSLAMCPDPPPNRNTGRPPSCLDQLRSLDPEPPRTL